jgi:hypothetical protein
LVDASKSAAACKDSTQAGSMSRKQATDGTKTFLPQAGVPAGHAGHDVLLVVSCEELWQGTMASTPGKAQWQGRLARNRGKGAWPGTVATPWRGAVARPLRQRQNLLARRSGKAQPGAVRHQHSGWQGKQHKRNVQGHNICRLTTSQAPGSHQPYKAHLSCYFTLWVVVHCCYQAQHLHGLVLWLRAFTCAAEKRHNTECNLGNNSSPHFYLDARTCSYLARC